MWFWCLLHLFSLRFTCFSPLLGLGRRGALGLFRGHRVPHAALWERQAARSSGFQAIWRDFQWILMNFNWFSFIFKHFFSTLFLTFSLLNVFCFALEIHRGAHSLLHHGPAQRAEPGADPLRGVHLREPPGAPRRLIRFRFEFSIERYLSSLLYNYFILVFIYLSLYISLFIVTSWGGPSVRCWSTRYHCQACCHVLFTCVIFSSYGL